jgi:hypothetical protein
MGQLSMIRSIELSFFKTAIAFLLLPVTVSLAGAEIMQGPILNPANGHEYYLLAPESWSAAETEGENLGGTLAIVKNAEEQKWIFAKFGNEGEQERSLWLGLRRQWLGGPFVWVDGSKLDYADWCGGQPDNGGGVENCVHMWAEAHNGGCWNDAVEGTSLCGVAEIPGKVDEKALTSREKALIGNWYEDGQPDREAWIVGTENKLFLITHDRHAARLILKSEDVIYDADRQYGEIVKDHILWSDHTWWSRHPAKYLDDRKAANQPVRSFPPGYLTD